MKGQKHDDGKQKWHALPLVILEPLADVMEAGAEKYEKFNCLEPFDNWDARFYNGMIRHIAASQIDPLAINEEDGGVYHLAQVAFNALMRLHNARRVYECEVSDETKGFLDKEYRWKSRSGSINTVEGADDAKGNI